MKTVATYTATIMITGFVARAIDGREIDILSPGIGQLLWLITPLILAAIYRLGRKEKSDRGLKPRFKASWRWYLVSLVLFPLLFWLITEAGVYLQSIVKMKPAWTRTFALAVALVVPASIIKNIFEEFVWRGFLYTRLEQQGLAPLQNHVLIGIIWAAWHLPYLDGFTAIYHDMSGWIYVPLFLIGTTVTSVIYGEIRRKSGTVWTAVLLHTMANAFVNTLFIDNYLRLAEGRTWWLAPTTDNLGYILLCGLVGWLLYGYSSESSAKD